jgi:hypothetical protein
MAVAVEVVEVVGVVGGKGEVNDEGAEGRRDQLPRGARGEIVGDVTTVTSKGQEEDGIWSSSLSGRRAAVRRWVGGRDASIARRALLWN